MSGPQFDQFGNQIQPPGEDGDGIKALRKQFKEQAKKIKDLEALNETLQSQTRSGSVADTLRDAGLDPRVAKFYPTDAPTTADAVAAWVDENRELFPAPKRDEGADKNQTTLTPDQQEGYRIMKLLGEAEAATALDFQSRADACETEEEFMALLAEFGETHAFG